MSMPLAPTTDFELGDVVVDLDHMDVVLHELGQRGRVEIGARDRTLHLGLLTLPDVDARADEVGGRRADRVAWLRTTLGPTFRPLDAVVDDLRAAFADRYGGWAPLVGKNRHVHGIVGYPQSKSMGDGTPDPADRDEYRIVDTPNAGQGVRVGVLDTRIAAHQDLSSAIRATSDNLLSPAGLAALSLPGEPAAPWAGHATFVAGLIAAQAPAADLVVRHLLREQDGRATAWQTAVAMAGFAGTGIEVLNLSLGCRTVDGLPPLVIQRAVDVLSRRMLLVAAAGNHGGSDNPSDAVYPAAAPGVVAVGAVRADGGLAEITPDVPWIRCVAPGVDVVSTFLDGPVRGVDEPFTGFASWSGTSFAAATVSGAVAAAIVPGELTARGALKLLLDAPNSVVRPYPRQHD